MAYEEKRLQKINVATFDTQLRDLQLEYEEFEIDGDDVAVRVHETFELLRRTELDRNRARAAKARQRKIIEERMRWKVNDVRVKVLERERNAVDATFFRANLAARRREMAETVVYKKRTAVIKQARKAAITQDADDRSARHRADLESQAGAVEKLKETYDTVVSGCASLLRAATVDLRQDKSQF
eukprot:CAMPEP_0118907904 /NCGR_PEP_ID=MMETSP1166-20130328/11148_1 /TAXON_ID=1104430 /ORGANISM="Chrysoreinhardia sp, Strain CCMP3193" /LENGTH=183 /DNA_ID=CAMNT_0006847283 /DNA_START=189 /DNA_END=740 /DNA_ORIENTATION=-